MHSLHQILFPLILNVGCAICLGVSVFHCNFIQVSNGWQDIHGASIGLWQTTDEINHGSMIFDATSYSRWNQCVPWTSEQVHAFDSFFNYGRYSGIITFLLSIASILFLVSKLYIKHSSCAEISLVCLQLYLCLSSGLLLLVLRSKICDEFECWPNLGAALSVVASVVYLVSSFATATIIGSKASELDNHHDKAFDADKSDSTTHRMDLDALDLP